MPSSNFRRAFGRPSGRARAPALLLAASCALFAAIGPREVAAQPAPPAVRSWDPAAAAAYLDQRIAWWMSWPNAARDHDTACISCHTSLPYALARPSLRAALGERVPAASETALVEGVRKRVALWNEVEPYYPDQTVGLPKTSESRGTEAVLNALVLADRDRETGQLSDGTGKALANLWALQFTRREGTGGWAWLHFGLAPWESDGAEYFGAALAAVAVGIAPGGYAEREGPQDRIDLLRAYLLDDWRSRPVFDRLMLAWAGAELAELLTPEETGSIVTDLGRLQNADGGWSLSSLREWPREDGSPQDPSSDGYATGLVAYVLQRTGGAQGEPGLGRALDWLVRHQDPITGGWWTPSLNEDRDPESDRGRFMSDAATAFAVLALTEAERGR